MNTQIKLAAARVPPSAPTQPSPATIGPNVSHNIQDSPADEAASRAAASGNGTGTTKSTNQSTETTSNPASGAASSFVHTIRSSPLGFILIVLLIAGVIGVWWFGKHKPPQS